MKISEDERAELAAVSERIGRDISLIQGPGGNTSVKDDDELWVKASGCWLSDALRRPIFVGLDRNALGGTQSGYDVPERAILPQRGSGSLRPSIETALHALMPQRVVIHAHSVNAMAVSVLQEGEAWASERLAGLNWGWIPYRRPGEPLARAVDELIRAAPRDVLLLQNHGVVVGAPTAPAGEAMLAEVEARLALPPRPLAGASAAPLPPSTRFEPDARASPFAIDPVAFRILTGGALVPDQVVFLGGAVPALAPAADADETADRLAARSGVVPALLLAEGAGALSLRSRSAAATALVAGLLAIAERIPEGMAVQTLGEADIAALLNWDAEKYRQGLNASDRS